MKYQWKSLLFISLVLWQSGVWANARRFNVEAIVFKQDASTSELFQQYVTQLPEVTRYANTRSGKKSLYGLYNRLKKSGKYRPFYYQAWVLGVSSGRISRPIDIYEAGHKLRGLLKLQRGELLHVLADVEYAPSESLEEDGVIYHIKEKRRVLLNEVHYLDHPKFGMIIKVSPY